MKKYMFIFMVILQNTVIGTAQQSTTFTEDKTIRISNSEVTSRRTVFFSTCDFDENLFITGVSNNEINFNDLNKTYTVSDHFLVKMSPSLDVQWTVSLENNKVTDMKTLPNGDVIVAGEITKHTPILGWGSKDSLFIARYSSVGDLLWRRVLGAINYPVINFDIDENENIYAIGRYSEEIITDDGFSVSAKRTEVYPTSKPTSIYLLKLDKDGNTKNMQTIIESEYLFTSTYSNFGYNESPNSTIKYLKGNLYFSFSMNLFDVVDPLVSKFNYVNILVNSATNQYNKLALNNKYSSFSLAKIDTLGQFITTDELSYLDEFNAEVPNIAMNNQGQLIITSPFLGLSMGADKGQGMINYDVVNNNPDARVYYFGSSTQLDLVYYNEGWDFDKINIIDKVNGYSRTILGISNNWANEVCVSGKAELRLDEHTTSIDLDPSSLNLEPKYLSKASYFSAVYTPNNEMIWGKYFDTSIVIAACNKYMYTVQTRGDIVVTKYVRNGDAPKYSPFTPNAINELGNDVMSSSVYPNPAISNIYIKGGTVGENYKITNLEGQLMSTGIYSSTRGIDVCDLLPGVYVVTVQHNQGYKFIKK